MWPKWISSSIHLIRVDLSWNASGDDFRIVCTIVEPVNRISSKYKNANCHVHFKWKTTLAFSPDSALRTIIDFKMLWLAALIASKKVNSARWYILIFCFVHCPHLIQNDILWTWFTNSVNICINTRHCPWSLVDWLAVSVMHCSTSPWLCTQLYYFHVYLQAFFKGEMPPMLFRSKWHAYWHRVHSFQIGASSIADNYVTKTGS